MKLLSVVFGAFLAGCVVSAYLPEARPTTPPTKKIRVMVIDTGIDGSIKELRPYLTTASSPQDLKDQHGHGTHVASLILKGRSLRDDVCREVEVISCRYYPNFKAVSTCIKDAIKMKVDIINFSGGGEEFDPLEFKLLKQFKGVLVTSAGNEGKNLLQTPYFPASLPLSNIVAVANGTSEQDRAPSSNFGLKKLVWIDGRNVKGMMPGGGYQRMTGTSQAAAIYTHALLKHRCQSLLAR